MFRAKEFIRRTFNRNGIFIYSRPAHFGAAQVSGTFPPKEAHFIIGRKEDYFIHEGYCHRSEPVFFDDEGQADNYQLEVYQFAKEICDDLHLDSICDVGCGSGYKLMRYFSDRKTVGIDAPDTCNRLRQRWPHRTWLQSDDDRFTQCQPPWPVDMVIASDIIEHLVNPDGLMSFVSRLRPRKIILSTPDRNLLGTGTYNGPPHNPAHIREWSFAEFEAYVSSWFKVEEHFISCASQATQCVLCIPREQRIASKPHQC